MSPAAARTTRCTPTPRGQKSIWSATALTVVNQMSTFLALSTLHGEIEDTQKDEEKMQKLYEFKGNTSYVRNALYFGLTCTTLYTRIIIFKQIRMSFSSFNQMQYTRLQLVVYPFHHLYA